jgi:hypothetical protein
MVFSAMTLQDVKNCPKDMDNIICIVLKQGSDNARFCRQPHSGGKFFEDNEPRPERFKKLYGHSERGF